MSIFPDVGAFVLAGGRSSRMGTKKALLKIGSQTLLCRTVVLLSRLAEPVKIIGPVTLQIHVDAEVLEDRFTRCGPLGGIATALASAERRWNVILACDLPYLTEDWLRFLAERALVSDAQIVMPISELGMEPLCAVYQREIAAHVSTRLQQGIRKVTDGLAGLRTEILTPAEWKSFDLRGRLFKNVNSPEDYEEARAALEPPAENERALH